MTPRHVGTLGGQSGARSLPPKSTSCRHPEVDTPCECPPRTPETFTPMTVTFLPYRHTEDPTLTQRRHFSDTSPARTPL